MRVFSRISTPTLDHQPTNTGDECHRELVKAMNRWNTFLTARAYHPLKIVHASSSNNMKIRMKRCHVDWEWKYLWILSRLASLIDKSRGKTTTRFACSSIEAMRNKLRELRNDLLDGKFDTEVSISRITRDVWKRYLKSDKVAFDKTAREGYKCAFGLNAYFESMRGHSMRGFCYPSKLSVRGKRWYNASCGSKVYDVTMNDDDEEEEKDDEEEKMDVEEKSDETSQFALSKANIPKVMSRISAFIEPYGDFVYVTPPSPDPHYGSHLTLTLSTGTLDCELAFEMMHLRCIRATR